MSEGGGGGKVMSDEQVEILRKQIAVYATISQQLAHSLTASSQNHLSASSSSGVRVGNLYCDSFLASGAHRIAGRQRWSPTPVQLQILERIFDQGTGTPNKVKIKEIATELSQHGHISETNVYNWFQNRRARSKRKQQAAPGTNEAESETETAAIVSPNNTKTKEDFQSQHILISSMSEDVCFEKTQGQDPSADEPEPVLPLEGSSKLGGTSFEQIPFYGSVLPNPRMEQLKGKMEVSGNYDPYMLQDDYHMTQ